MDAILLGLHGVMGAIPLRSSSMDTFLSIPSIASSGISADAFIDGLFVHMGEKLHATRSNANLIKHNCCRT